MCSSFIEQNCALEYDQQAMRINWLLSCILDEVVARRLIRYEYGNDFCACKYQYRKGNMCQDETYTNFAPGSSKSTLMAVKVS